MAKGEIVAIRDVAMNLADPTSFTHKEIQYRIDGQGPYVVYLPSEQFSADKALEIIKQKVKDWAATVGRGIESK